MNESIILVPLDGTLAARAAVPVAGSLAQLTGANVHMIHVSSGVPPPLSKLAELLGLEGVALRGWSIVARSGEPSAWILDEAMTMRASLIVMCTHTAAVRPKGILGHTALDVLRGAPCPVVLVSPMKILEAWKPKRILLPYDGSPAANAAVAPAAALARCAHGQLLVLQVGAAVTAAIDPGSLTMPRYVDQPQHEWPSWSDELLERLSCQCPLDELRAHLYIRGGQPASEIVRFATEHSADLIVLAWKGEWTGQHARTLKVIVRDAPCPLMIVHARESTGAQSGPGIHRASGVL